MNNPYAYIVLKCDGRVELLDCKDPYADDFNCDYDVMFHAWELWKHDFPCELRSPDRFRRLDVGADSVLGKGEWRWRESKSQNWFSARTSRRLFNRAAWKILGEVHLGDIFSCPMSLTEAEKKREEIADVLAAAEERPIPYGLLREKMIGTDDAAFFARCQRKGMLDPFNVVLRFKSQEDFAWFDENCNHYTEHGDPDDEEGDTWWRAFEWGVIDQSGDDTFVLLNDGFSAYPKTPINDGALFSLRSRKLNEMVVSGRVDVFVALRFPDVDAFEIFRSKERAREGESWKAVFRNYRCGNIVNGYTSEFKPDLVNGWKGLGDTREYAYDKEGRFKSLDAVLVATSLPVPWVDKTPWRELRVNGMEGGAK